MKFSTFRVNSLWKIIVVLVFLCLSMSLAAKGKKTARFGQNLKKVAIVSLVTSHSQGYYSGALALGHSLSFHAPKNWSRILLVTEKIEYKLEKSLKQYWEIQLVEPIVCNHVHGLDSSKFDLNSRGYREGVSKWALTCTKFAAWKFTAFDRVIFMDSDMLAIGSLENALTYSPNAYLVAAPESFPPDTFNSGFMVLRPSLDTFNTLVRLNEEIGSAEGGDQGVFNNALCPNWFFEDTNSSTCGRLPWIYNVEVAYFEKYRTLQTMTRKQLPVVLHFVSEGKPWTMLHLEYLSHEERKLVPAKTLLDLSNQAQAHILWRQAYFAASGNPSRNEFLISLVENNGTLSSMTKKSSASALSPDKERSHSDKKRNNRTSVSTSGPNKDNNASTAEIIVTGTRTEQNICEVNAHASLDRKEELRSIQLDDDGSMASTTSKKKKRMICRRKKSPPF